jgi:aminoglycoside phosphotransferase (APT) family kinase protein
MTALFTSALDTKRNNSERSRSQRIANALLRYLSDCFGIHDLQYHSPPIASGDGWENYIYHFQLEPTDSLPSEFCRPVTLRLFPGPARAVQARYEVAVQRSLHRCEFPVPAPLWWEQGSEVLGGPFLIMQQVAGLTMLQALFRRPWRVVQLCRQMAEVQARLHELPVERFPCRPGRLLDRTLVEMESVIEENRWHGLANGLDWLIAHRVLSPSRRGARLLHLDFHPLNLIERLGRLPAVLDWGTADVGDPHADVATTLMLMRCAPIEGKNAWQRGFAPFGRAILHRVYLGVCRRRMELCETKLAYYQAWAVFRWLIQNLNGRGIDPGTLGVRPSFRDHLRADHFQELVAEFKLLTGVELTLPEIAKATGR